ncbi:PREDICTED: torsin-4A-B-like, partial [Pterocles gutturalis]|uniref:torsin-4A-B-like n=1 Tax=Pterocles gutturalis TaxID=240206 RepID=UPI000528D6CF
MLSYTRENIFSSTDLLKTSSESLARPMFAAQTIRRPPGLPPKRSRKARKVLYPAQVRKYLPRQEKDPVKRWLLVFVGIILMQ